MLVYQRVQSAKAELFCRSRQEIRPARAEDTPGCTSAGRACAASQVAVATWGDEVIEKIFSEAVCEPSKTRALSSESWRIQPFYLG
jgi:hypothetical protein